MTDLAVAGALFLLTHLGISSTPLRSMLVRAVGERPYQGVYSLIALATLGYLIWTYLDTPQFDYLWAPSAALRWVPLLVMPFAFILMLGGFLAPNPTAVGMEGRIAEPPRGLVRVTRHPFQWSVVLWSVSHVIANGDAASLIFFGSLGSVSLLGTFLLDRKKAARIGPQWEAFAAVTSNVPFAAIAAGRNSLLLGELWLPVVVGLLGYALVLWGHEWISGVALI